MMKVRINRRNLVPDWSFFVECFWAFVSVAALYGLNYILQDIFPQMVTTPILLRLAMFTIVGMYVKDIIKIIIVGREVY
jgi:hypothetical protein